MRALVCGGRDYQNEKHVFDCLDAMAPDEICHGGASGADALAGSWASKRGVPCRIFHADWRKHGLSAGPKRNAEMLEKFAPDTVIAFPGGKGTADMIRRAKRAGLMIIEFA